MQYSAAVFCTFADNSRRERQCVLPPQICTRSNLPWQHQWHWLSPVRSLLCASPFELACDTKIGREVPVDAIFSCQENTELEALRCFEIVLLSTGLDKKIGFRQGTIEHKSGRDPQDTYQVQLIFVLFRLSSQVACR